MGISQTRVPAHPRSRSGACAPIGHAGGGPLRHGPSRKWHDGTVLAWGGSFNDGFGLGMPIPKTPENHRGENLWRPQEIPGLTGVKAISAGGGFALALLENGTIKAWGRNHSGEIGDEVISGSTVPVTIPGIDSAVAISAGLDYALAILRDGTVRVWGSGAFDGVHFAGSRSPSIHTDTDAHWTAKPVAIPGLRNAVAIATGTSALALLADGTVLAWGGSFNDGFGLGMPIPKTPENHRGENLWRPQEIPGLTGVKA
ncbi:MAG: hypothetical protein LAN71_12940, partial [Acidobacteriia bacterium]|nr:hypothetical protein [Terriglobia bacterium]